MKKPTIRQIMLLGCAVLGLSSVNGQAQAIVPTFVDYSPRLGGTTQNYVWSGFSAETKPAGVSSGTSGQASQWLSGIAPNSGSAVARFSGNSSFGTDTTDFISASSGGGIYAFFSQTHFTVTDTTPLSNIQSLTFQIYLAAGLSGQFGGSHVDLFTAPSLTLNTTNGTQTLAANFSLSGSLASATLNGMPTTLDLLNYQWDLSGVTGTVQSYTVNWQTSYHSQTMGTSLTESSAINTSSVLVVPEPSTWALLLAGCAGLVYFSQRRRTNPALG